MRSLFSTALQLYSIFFPNQYLARCAKCAQKRLQTFMQGPVLSSELLQNWIFSTN
jgi:hypothetical protein